MTSAPLPRLRMRREQSSWSTTCSRPRSINDRSRSVQTAWSIRQPSISTARVVCSAVSFSDQKFVMDHVHQVIRQTGPSLSPFNAWVLLKGLETLSVRVERETRTAGAVADALAGHPKITRL